MRKTDALLLVVVVAVFGPSVFGGFVYDDQILILRNELTDSLTNVPAFFSMDLWEGVWGHEGDSGFYRPLMLVGLALDRALFGLEPSGYHLHSVAWLLLGVGLLLAWFRQLELPPAAAIAGAALYALHPIQVEAVMFISARNDLMAAAFLFAALLLLTGDELPTWRVVLGAVAVLAGALSKESVVLVPFLLVAADRVRDRPVRWEAIGAALGGILGYVLLRLQAGVGAPEASVGDAFTQMPAALAVYARSFLDPGLRLVGPSLDHVDVVYLWCVPAVLVLAGIAWTTDRRGYLGVLLAALTSAPAALVIGRTHLVADRYLTLAMAGIGLAVAASCARLPERPQRVVAGLLVLGLAVATSRSIPVWNSDVDLRVATAEARPNPHTIGSLAKTLENAGELDAAAEAYRAATQAPEPYPHSCFNVTAIHLKRGDAESAASEGLRALAAGCEASPELVAPMALGMALSGDWEQAEAHARWIDADPTGQAVLVRVGAAARRGDLEPLGVEAAARGGGKAELAEQVAWLLQTSGYPESARRVREEGLR
ncbi:MAG: hypothetical protein GY913_02400 [Proteobacteria bacterium]|nr:hypothetical protein [Pseudomonadota bacterium]MCP4915751.1 hypothetical protein [Pseudomonadota bacterium]